MSDTIHKLTHGHVERETMGGAIEFVVCYPRPAYIRMRYLFYWFVRTLHLPQVLAGSRPILKMHARVDRLARYTWEDEDAVHVVEEMTKVADNVLEVSRRYDEEPDPAKIDLAVKQVISDYAYLSVIPAV